MSDQSVYYPQERDFINSLDADLRNLQGMSTLVYELVQNADDVKDEQGRPGATLIAFDLRDDALRVFNDGRFSDCGHLDENECPWSNQYGRRCDFHRMLLVGAADKRNEADTIGAFGIGFNAVYQVTDRPEIISSGRHLLFRPDEPTERRVQGWTVPDAGGTTFVLPWALDPSSPLRRLLLSAPSVSLAQLPQFEADIADALTLAALFLRNLRTLELKRDGLLLKRVEREPVSQDELVIRERDRECRWYLFHADFADRERALRERHLSAIEPKRHSRVTVAISDQEPQPGRLHAVLPTEDVLPFAAHVSADFFPSSDRKRVLLDPQSVGFQQEWNLAALRAAAQALANGISRLPAILGHQRLWALLQALNQAAQQATEGTTHPAYSCFWESMSDQGRLRDEPIVFTTSGLWVRPGAARLLESEEERRASPLFEALGLHLVHPDLRGFFGLLRQADVGTPLLTVSDIVGALQRAGLSAGRPLEEGPRYLSSIDTCWTLWKALDALLNPRTSRPKEPGAQELLAACPLALDDQDRFQPPRALFRGDQPTRTLFPQVAWLANGVPTDGIPGSLVPAFAVADAIKILSSRTPADLLDAWLGDRLDFSALYAWLEERRAQITSDPHLVKPLVRLPIWPWADGLAPLSSLFLPTGFEDPLRLSSLLDLEALRGHHDFVKDLGVQELTLRTYLLDVLPRALREQPNLETAKRREIVHLLARELGHIRDDPEVRRRLSQLPLVECSDGSFCQPPRPTSRARP